MLTKINKILKNQPSMHPSDPKKLFMRNLKGTVDVHISKTQKKNLSYNETNNFSDQKTLQNLSNF